MEHQSQISLDFFSGTNRQTVEIEQHAPLTDLMAEVETLTQVPATGQKLILNGKSLTSQDKSKSLADLKVFDGAKIMVLGRRYDPEADEMYKKVAEVDRKAEEVEKRLAEVKVELADYEKGYVPQEHKEKALKGLSRRCKSGTEEFMRQLETLDSFSMSEAQNEARSKRKTVINSINAKLDKNDALSQKIDALISQLPK